MEGQPLSAHINFEAYWEALGIENNLPHEILQIHHFPPFLTPKQAAAMLQVSQSCIYRWSKEELLEEFASKGNPLRIKRDPLVEWFFERRGKRKHPSSKYR